VTLVHHLRDPPVPRRRGRSAGEEGHCGRFLQQA